MNHLSALVLWSLLGGAAPQEGVLLQDGREIPGEVTALVDGGLKVAGETEPIPLYEINAIHLAHPSGDGTAPEEDVVDLRFFDKGPLVRFRDGESLRGRVLEADEHSLTIQIADSSSSTGAHIVLKAPMEILRAFRLREALLGDDIFESDLARAADIFRSDPLRSGSRLEGSETDGPKSPATAGTTPDSKPASLSQGVRGDVVYVRRRGGLMRVEGVFRSLDSEYLSLSFEGEPRRLRRQLVHAVLLAPVASMAVETELPALFVVRGAGRFPGYLRGIQGKAPERELLLRFHGAPKEETQTIPEALIQQVKFFSDRVLFLSSVEPTAVEETPLVGAKTPFPWQRDRAVGGGALRLGGKTYRKGVGVHSYAALEYEIGASYRSLAATIGLDDSAGEEAGVTFRVIADGKEIYKKSFVYGSKPENLSLPVGGVKRIRLEVDYGDDGLDFGDHADWADLRVTR